MVSVLDWQITMQYKQSLRSRITISFFLFSIVLSGLIALVVYLSLENIESAIIEDSLLNELVNFQEYGQQPLNSISKPSAYITRYYSSIDDREWLPSYLQVMPLGLNELQHQNSEFYVQVADIDNTRVYILKNVTDFEEREVALHWALVVICIIGPLFSLWVGQVVSGRVIEPVANLARQLDAMPADSRHSPRVASAYAHDEVGQLALTFDQYLERIETFIAREQEFTGNASHELRTPLAIIQGAAEILLENSELSEKAHGQVARIFRASQRMSQMVEVLLMLARSCDVQETACECNLQNVVDEMLEQHCSLLDNKPITIRCEVDTATIGVPKALLAIALGNLFRNAATYTEQGEIVIKGDRHSIHVIDSGCGISEADQQRIFQRHYRGERTPSQRGSGIGLSIVQRICERYQWDIQLQSEEGVGTTITLLFEKEV